MEILFQTQTIRYLAEKRFDDLHQEQTGEISVPETLPELGRVVDCFGVVLTQSRSVDSGSVTVSGGIQAGVLYVPAEGEGLERLELWLPFTVTKKLPVQPDTVLHYWGWLRSMEARFVNARKLLIRADLASELTLLSPAELELSRLESCPRGLICRTETYPMRLPLCAAEKEVRVADEVLMPENGPGLDRLLKTQCAVEISERRVMGEKAVFQGELRLRVLGLTEAGEPVTWSGTVPFSQYAELDRSMEEQSHISIQPILNHLELDRFFDSSSAYQGMARNMGMDFVAGLNMAATGGLKPDVTFFFDISVEEALARRGKRGEASDRIELAGIKFQEDVRKGYLELAKESDGRIVTVDASRGVEEIFEDIKETLKGKI